MKAPLLLAALTLIPAFLLAQEEARLTVSAEDVELAVVSNTDTAAFSSNSKQNAEKTKMLNSLEVTMQASQEEWLPLSITFKAAADTKVNVQLGGGRGGSKSNHVFFDKMEAANAAVENGDFEAAGKKAPKGWKAVNWDDDTEHAAADPAKAASGSGYAVINGKSFIVQSIPVKKDTEVTFTVLIRSGAD